MCVKKFYMNECSNVKSLNRRSKPDLIYIHKAHSIRFTGRKLTQLRESLNLCLPQHPTDTEYKGTSVWIRDTCTGRELIVMYFTSNKKQIFDTEKDTFFLFL